MTKCEFLPEPELEFGLGRHIDIRFGLMSYGPLDVARDLAPKIIRVGIVGTPRTVEGVREWLERCRAEVPAKVSRQPNLFPKFPGFRQDTGFHSNLATDPNLERTISEKVVESIVGIGDLNRSVAEAVDEFHDEFKYLVENANVDVLICAVPHLIANLMDPDLRPARSTVLDPLYDFHDLLKARSMDLGRPIQLILPGTYDPSARRKRKTKVGHVRQLQDEATRAWNIHTALYYKAGGLPWRLIRDLSQFTTCYVGISFYRSLDRTGLRTSMAQVFDERGDGMVIRGGPVELGKEDKVAHLTRDDAANLLGEALEIYRRVHETLPARVFVQKTSSFSPEELAGLNEALKTRGVAKADFVSIANDMAPRLFREGQYPPLRGTFLSLDHDTHVLYTCGSVDFYSTYPGLYVPRPLVFQCAQTEQTPKYLAREILALTKMNWNKTQFDGRLPITIEAARKVGRILKYLAETDQTMPQYRYYM